jgi:hypothetical protein
LRERFSPSHQAKAANKKSFPPLYFNFPDFSIEKRNFFLKKNERGHKKLL